MDQPAEKKNILHKVDISEEDIYEAMKDISGYLDITPGDIKKVYLHAYRHAVGRIMHSVKASDIMTRSVFYVKRKTSLQEVAEIMADKGVAGVPVLEGDMEVAGVISERDFISHLCINKTENFMCLIRDCLRTKSYLATPIREKDAEDIMTSPAITIREETTLTEIINLFTDNEINRAPVLDINGHLVGIVSRADIIRALYRS